MLHAHLLYAPGTLDSDTLREQLLDAVTLTVNDEMPPDDTVDVVVAGRIQPRHLQDRQRLRALIIPFAGVPRQTRETLLALPSPPRIFNLHHNAQCTAELALTLLLNAARRIIPADQALRHGDWRPRYDHRHGVSLFGRRALIVGYGAIGRALTPMLNALGVGITATRRRCTTRTREGRVDVFPANALLDLLPDTDVLIVCAPLTPATEGLIDAHALDRLPDPSVIVNVARGPIIDAQALYNHLSARPASSAGIDVWYNYPRDEDSRRDTQPADVPLHTLDNMVLSPHRGSDVAGIETLRAKHLAMALNTMARGGWPEHEVDVEAGY